MVEREHASSHPSSRMLPGHDPRNGRARARFPKPARQYQYNEPLRGTRPGERRSRKPRLCRSLIPEHAYRQIHLHGEESCQSEDFVWTPGELIGAFHGPCVPSRTWFRPPSCFWRLHYRQQRDFFRPNISVAEQFEAQVTRGRAESRITGHSSKIKIREELPTILPQTSYKPVYVVSARPTTRPESAKLGSDYFA